MLAPSILLALLYRSPLVLTTVAHNVARLVVFKVKPVLTALLVFFLRDAWTALGSVEIYQVVVPAIAAFALLLERSEVARSVAVWKLALLLETSLVESIVDCNGLVHQISEIIDLIVPSEFILDEVLKLFDVVKLECFVIEICMVCVLHKVGTVLRGRSGLLEKDNPASDIVFLIDVSKVLDDSVAKSGPRTQNGPRHLVHLLSG